MKYIWQKFGHFCFLVTRPVLGIYLPQTMRTRVLVMRGDELLVVKNWLGDERWGLPGGGRHRGETLVQAARRELYEETGIIVTEAELKELFHDTLRSPHVHFDYQCYLLQLSTDTPIRVRRRLEITDIAWLPKQSFADHNAHPDIQRALEFIKA